MAILDNLFKETYISDIVKRNKIRNVGEMEALLSLPPILQSRVIQMKGF